MFTYTVSYLTFVLSLSLWVSLFFWELCTLLLVFVHEVGLLKTVSSATEWLKLESLRKFYMTCRSPKMKNPFWKSSSECKQLIESIFNGNKALVYLFQEGSFQEAQMDLVQQKSGWSNKGTLKGSQSLLMWRAKSWLTWIILGLSPPPLLVWFYLVAISP